MPWCTTQKEFRKVQLKETGRFVKKESVVAALVIESLTSVPVLALPKITSLCTLDTDTCKKRCVPFQEQEDGSTGSVRYFTYTL